MGDSSQKRPRGRSLDAKERRQVSQRLRPRAAVVYEVIREEGEEELSRSASALAWSGLAAGISIGLSMISEGLLAAHLPDTQWKPLLENFGYCVGFLVVIMGRQQLFTENTITVVLPLLKSPSNSALASVIRLWCIVLAANLVGCLMVALFVHLSPVFSDQTVQAFTGIAHHLLGNTPLEMFTKGIVAGWLIAALVWLLPSAHGSAQIWSIIIITYLIALGDLTHIIAGSVEAFLLWIQGGIGLASVAAGFMLPTLAGNIVGGTALFALLSYGQVHDEIN